MKYLKQSVQCMKLFLDIYSPLFLQTLLIILSSISILLPDASAQLAKRSAPLSDGYLRLMDDGTLIFSGQIEVRGEFLAGGTLDSSNPNYEEGTYYSVESEPFRLKGKVLDLHFDGVLYYLLKENETTGETNLLIYDKAGMKDLALQSRFNNSLIDYELRTVEAIDIDTILTSSLALAGSAWMDGSYVAQSVCLAVAVTSLVYGCVSRLLVTNDPNSKITRDEFQKLFEGGRAVSQSSQGFYSSEDTEGPLVKVSDENGTSENDKFIPLSELGYAFHGFTGRLCEVGFLGL